jgi:hypothetical protein
LLSGRFARLGTDAAFGSACADSPLKINGDKINGDRLVKACAGQRRERLAAHPPETELKYRLLITSVNINLEVKNFLG